MSLGLQRRKLFLLLCHHIWMPVMSFLLIWTDYQFHVCRLFRMQQYAFLLNPANTFIFTTVLYYVLQLPVDFRIWLKVLVLTFISQNVHAPDYLCQLFTIHSAAHGLWSQAQSLLVVQLTNLSLWLLNCGTVFPFKFTLLTLWRT